MSGAAGRPAIIDAHVHMPSSTTREELVAALAHKAYYGVGAVMSLGQDGDGGRAARPLGG